MRILPLDHRAIGAMVGAEIEGPRTAAEWRAFVNEVTERDQLAKLNLDHSDEEAKLAMRQKIMNKLSPAQRISMSREGTLEGWLSDEVADEMHRRAGLL